MNSLDLTLPTPAANLACDEALLDWCEAAATATAPAPAILRFWESPASFVVLGYSNAIATEVNVPACRARGVPVLRRCTGGGTVVQGPGCLNYALILSVMHDPALAGVVETNRFIMTRHRAALAGLLGRPVTFDGHTDLAVDGRKFSGNSQRRKRTHLLFHGTFLLHFDLPAIAELLRMPSRQPAYRQGRPHLDFLTNLDQPAAAVQAVLRDAWGAHENWTGAIDERVRRLVTEKYGTREWVEKF